MASGIVPYFKFDRTKAFNIASGSSTTFEMSNYMSVVYVKRNDTSGSSYSEYLLFYNPNTGFAVSTIHEESTSKATFTNNGRTITVTNAGTAYEFFGVLNF